MEQPSIKSSSSKKPTSSVADSTSDVMKQDVSDVVKQQNVTNIAKQDVSGITITMISNKSIKLQGDILDKRIFEFEIDGVDNSITGALRRTMIEELKVSSLNCQYDNIDTNNEETIRDMVVKRMAQIPIHQSCPLDAVFYLEKYNNTQELIYVKTSDFKIKRFGSGTPLTGVPFEDCNVLCSLQKNRYIKISDITVKADYGYNFACNTVAVHVSIIPKQDTLVRGYDPQSTTTDHISNTKITSWVGRFQTNGTMGPIEILKITCDSVIKRLRAIQTYSKSGIATKDNVSKLIILNETDTIGNLMQRGILEVYPSIPAIVPLVDNASRKCTLSARLNKSDDLNEIINAAIENRIKILSEIAKQIDTWGS